MRSRLKEGYEVAGRQGDVIVTGRQFLEIFPKHALANTARDRIDAAYEHTGRGNLAAAERQAVWENGGTTGQGVRALLLFIQANNGSSFQQASTLAVAMVAKLPAGPLLTGVGFQGMHAAERAKQ